MFFFTNTFLGNNIAWIELDSLSAPFGMQFLSLDEITQDNNTYFRVSRMVERVGSADVRYCLWINKCMILVDYCNTLRFLFLNVCVNQKIIFMEICSWLLKVSRNCTRYLVVLHYTYNGSRDLLQANKSQLYHNKH
jgi:hypothetical protein